MTNNWVDIKNANLVLIMGGNAAEAHPCGFKWVTEAKAHNKARLVVVDPRFTRSAAVADYYAPIRAGSDIAFLGGVINYLLGNDKIQHEYVKAYTDASFIVREDFGFQDGLFSGYDADKHRYEKSSWMYELDGQGYAKVDPTLQHPRCVFNLMKTHYSRYTPEMVARITGTPQEQFLKICEQIAETAAPDKTMTILYALGWTQHSQGSQMIRAGAMVQTAAGQHRHAGRGHERAARPLEHTGAHRSRAAVQPAARLSHPAERKGGGVRRVHRQAHAQAAASGPAQLLVELSQVPRQPDEGLVRQRGDQGQQLVLRLVA